MNLRLAEISAQVAADAHAVVILDQAGWHGARALGVPHNVSLLPLPPDSPELNPVANWWPFLKQNFLLQRHLEPPPRRPRPTRSITTRDADLAARSAWAGMARVTWRCQPVRERTACRSARDYAGSMWEWSAGDPERYPLRAVE